jgi:hypothetical protein
LCERVASSPREVDAAREDHGRSKDEQRKAERLKG